MSAQLYDWPPRRCLDIPPEQVATDARSFYAAMDAEFLDSTPPRTDGSVVYIDPYMVHREQMEREFSIPALIGWLVACIVAGIGFVGSLLNPQDIAQ